MTRFEERLVRGEANDESEWEEYLTAFHARFPAATPTVMRDMRTAGGNTSYDVLASAVAPLAGAPAILDVGCGNGFASEAVAAQFPHARYAGVDISPSEIALARRTYPQSTFTVARAQALPFAAGTFDAVISHLALMLVNEAQRVFAELFRVSRPGAPVAIVIDNMASMAGDLYALHLTAGRFMQTVFKGLGKLQMGNAPFNDTGALQAMAAAAGFDESSLRISDFAVHAARDKDQVSRYFAWLYVLGSIPKADAERLRGIVLAEFERIARNGLVEFEIPMRLVTFRKPL